MNRSNPNDEPPAEKKLEFSSEKIDRQSNGELFERVSDKQEQKVKSKADREAKKAHRRAKRAMRKARTNAAKQNLSRKGIAGEVQFYLFYGWRKFATVAVTALVLGLAIGIPVSLKIKADRVIEREQEIAQEAEEEKEILEIPAVRAERIRSKALDLYEKKGGLAGREVYLKAIDEADPDDLQYISLLMGNFFFDDERYNGDPDFLLPYAIKIYEQDKNYANAIMVSRLYREIGDDVSADEYQEIAFSLDTDNTAGEY